MTRDFFEFFFLYYFYFIFFNFARSELTSCFRALPEDFCQQKRLDMWRYSHFQAPSDTSRLPIRTPLGSPCRLLDPGSARTPSLERQTHRQRSKWLSDILGDASKSKAAAPVTSREQVHACKRLLPLSTMWSKPPSSRSSSLNQSPALLEVRESSVSMARCPVCNTQSQVPINYSV